MKNENDRAVFYFSEPFKKICDLEFSTARKRIWHFLISISRLNLPIQKNPTIEEYLELQEDLSNKIQ